MSSRPELSHGISELSTAEKGETPKPKNDEEEYDVVKMKKTNDDLNLILAVVTLLASVITSFVVYLEPKLAKDSSGKVNAPSIVSASQYILYFALLITLAGGAVGLIFRLTTAVILWRLADKQRVWVVTRWVYKICLPIIPWSTIFALLCSLGLLFLGATLQLPIFIRRVKFRVPAISCRPT